jgi:hypothetical protein
MKELNDTTRCYPRTLDEAFPKSAEYAQAIEHYPSGSSGLFEFILFIIALGLLGLAIGLFS